MGPAGVARMSFPPRNETNGFQYATRESARPAGREPHSAYVDLRAPTCSSPNTRAIASVFAHTLTLRAASSADQRRRHAACAHSAIPSLRETKGRDFMIRSTPRIGTEAQPASVREQRGTRGLDPRVLALPSQRLRPRRCDDAGIPAGSRPGYSTDLPVSHPTFTS